MHTQLTVLTLRSRVASAVDTHKKDNHKLHPTHLRNKCNQTWNLCVAVQHDNRLATEAVDLYINNNILITYLGKYSFLSRTFM